MTVKRFSRMGLLGMFLIVTGLSSGCKKKGAPPPAAPQPAAAAQAKQPVAVQKAVSTATVAGPTKLDFTTRKDPFKPFVAVAPKPVTSPKSRGGDGSLLPILTYEVQQFRLIGIVAGLKENRAMVVDPAGKPYVLKEGMIIGKNSGKITRIANSHVEVTETYREDSGKLKSHVVRLTLPKKS